MSSNTIIVDGYQDCDRSKFPTCLDEALVVLSKTGANEKHANDRKKGTYDENYVRSLLPLMAHHSWLPQVVW